MTPSASITAEQATQCLEPSVVAEGLNPTDLVTVQDHHIMLSISHSLKRIADSLQLLSECGGVYPVAFRVEGQQGRPTRMTSRQQAWKERVTSFQDPHFARAPTTLRSTDVSTDLCGHFVSIGFSPGSRYYVFEGQQNRDRFLNQYRPHKPIACKDPCP